MIRLFFSFLLVLCSFSNFVSAILHPNPCRFGVQGELLYLQAFADATPFATQVLSSTTQKNLFHVPDYQLGYRIEGNFALDCMNNLYGRFTYLNSNHNLRTVDGTFAFGAPLNFTGTVKDDVRFRYYAGELLYGRWLFNSCDFNLDLEAGLIYANIKYTDLITASGPTTPTATTHAQSYFWGVGPEVVVSFKYSLPSCFCGILSFTADARESLLISKTRPSIFGADGFNLLSEHFFGVVPASDLRLGLSWTQLCSCFQFNIEAGYEWIYYHRAFIQSTTSANISFQGPYFALGAAF